MILEIFILAYVEIASLRENREALKALDFSLDNDWQSDQSNSYTQASLQKENLPSSFTICTSFMVRAWMSDYADALLFALLGADEDDWLSVRIYAETNHTEFSLEFKDSPILSVHSKVLFYPLQWTRVCLSKDSNTSLSRLVVDGDLLIEKAVEVNKKPDNLYLVLGVAALKVLLGPKQA